MATASIRAGGVLDDDDPSLGTNVANHFEFTLGDLEEGFKQADVIVERDAHTAELREALDGLAAGTLAMRCAGAERGLSVSASRRIP